MSNTEEIPLERFVRVSVAARRLGCSHSTLKSLIQRRELAAIRLGPNGHRRVSEDSVNRLIERSGNA